MHIQTRTTAAGTRYKAIVRVRPFPTVSRTFASKRHARTWAASKEADYRTGRVLPEAVAEQHTVAEMIGAYVQSMWHAQPRKVRSAQVKQAQLAWWARHLGALPLSQLSRAVIANACDTLLAQGRSTATINRYTAALRSVCRVYRERHQWLAHDPFAGMRSLKEPPGRTRHANGKELQALFRAAQGEGRKVLVFVFLLVATGARKGEMASVRHRDVDMLRGRVLLHDTKTSQPRVLYVTNLAREVLHDYMRRNPGRPGDYVFRPRGSSQKLRIDRAFQRLRERAGLDDFRVHDLRHTFASLYAAGGGSLMDLMAAIGHRKVETTQRYVHLINSHVEGMVSRMTAGQLDDVVRSVVREGMRGQRGGQKRGTHGA